MEYDYLFYFWLNLWKVLFSHLIGHFFISTFSKCVRGQSCLTLIRRTVVTLIELKHCGLFLCHNKNIFIISHKYYSSKIKMKYLFTGFLLFGAAICQDVEVKDYDRGIFTFLTIWKPENYFFSMSQWIFLSGRSWCYTLWKGLLDSGRENSHLQLL